jgi:hypothetical protein
VWHPFLVVGMKLRPLRRRLSCVGEGEKECDKLITSDPLMVGVGFMGVEGSASGLTLVSGDVCWLSVLLDDLLLLGGGGSGGGKVLVLLFCVVGRVGAAAVFSLGVYHLPLVRVREAIYYEVCCFHHIQVAMAVLGVQWR